MIIGTHRLLSPDVEFKNLGFLVIDEEHKFGVSFKEKLLKNQSHLDLLSLSATPIPRTLNMSFSGIKDLSLLAVAPKNRKPVKTFIRHFNADLVLEKILNEKSRGGQCFFVQNHIKGLSALFEEIQKKLPKNVTAFLAHGQMPKEKLEKAFVSFLEGKIDILFRYNYCRIGPRPFQCKHHFYKQSS